MTSYAIRAQFDAVRSIQQSIAGLRDQENWRHALIVRRRELSIALSGLIEQNRAWIAPAELRVHHRALSNSLSTLRSALAFHQASWPAVSIEHDAPDYLKSVGDLRAAFYAVERQLVELEKAADASALNE